MRPKEEGTKAEPNQMSASLMKDGTISGAKTKRSAVRGQDLCRGVLGGRSRSVFAVVNEGGEVSLYFLSNSEV